MLFGKHNTVCESIVWVCIWNEVNPRTCAGLRARQPGRRSDDGDQLLGLPGHSGDHHQHGRFQTGIAFPLHSPSPSTLCTASCSRTLAQILITSLHPRLCTHCSRPYTYTYPLCSMMLLKGHSLCTYASLTECRSVARKGRLTDPAPIPYRCSRIPFPSHCSAAFLSFQLMRSAIPFANGTWSTSPWANFVLSAPPGRFNSLFLFTLVSLLTVSFFRTSKFAPYNPLNFLSPIFISFWFI